MSKFKVIQDVVLIGRLNYGRVEKIVKAKSKNDAIKKAKNDQTEYEKILLKDYTIYDYYTINNKLEVNEIEENDCLNSTQILEDLLVTIREEVCSNEIAEKLMQQVNLVINKLRIGIKMSEFKIKNNEIDIHTMGKYTIYRTDCNNAECVICKCFKLCNAELIKDILNADMEEKNYIMQNNQIQELRKKVKTNRTLLRLQ